MSRISARQRVDRTPLSEPVVEKVVRRHMQRRSEAAPVDYAALLNELRHFGVATEGQFRQLLIKYKRTFRAEDKAAVQDSVYVNACADELGFVGIADRRRRQYWFGWEGQVRSALENEFGEAYEAFARERDGL